MHRFTLTFAQQECRRCGEIRIRGVACPVCGSPPDERESDPAAQRRRAAARAMTSRLDAQLEESTARILLDPDEIRAASLKWLDEFFAAMGEATNSHFREPARLWASLEALLWLDALCASAERLRPSIRIWSSISAIVERFKQMFREYLAALEASTPRIGTRASEQAQNHLSTAGREHQALNAYLDRFDKLAEADGLKEAYELLLNEALDSSGANDILDLDETGRSFLASIDLHESAAGMGIVALLGGTEAEFLYDERRFWKVVTDTYALLVANSQRFEVLVDDSNWVDDLARASQQQFDTHAVYGAALARAEKTSHQVRALLDIALALFEGPAKTYIATLLALKGVASYQSLKRRDAGALLDLAKQHGLESVLGGISKSMRAARAHEEFTVSEQRVVIGRGPGSEEMHVEHLLDAVLKGLESVSALALATILLASYLELDEVLRGALSPAGLPWTDWAHLVLRLAGWVDITLEMNDDELAVQASPSGRAAELRTVAMVLPHLPEMCSSTRFMWSDEAGTHVLTGPIGPMANWRAAQEDLPKSDFLIEAQRAWRLDDSPLATQDQVRQWVAINLARRVDAPLSDLVRRGRELHELVRRLGDEEAMETIDAFIGAARGRAMGLQPTAQQSEGTNRLASWLRLPSI